MTDYHVLFSGQMVRAILDGRKTQTRRTGKAWFRRYERFQAGERPWLWVRESWATWMVAPVSGGALSRDPVDILYKADGSKAWEDMEHDRALLRQRNIAKEDGRTGNWVAIPSTRMPRWASRLSLEVTDMRKERLQDISEEDARAEGISRSPHGNGDQWIDYPSGSSAAGWLNPRDSFRSLWNSIHGPGAWNANPEVIVISFRVHKMNIDEVSHD